jgi:Domain of unknown function (DUF4192)
VANQPSGDTATRGPATAGIPACLQPSEPKRVVAVKNLAQLVNLAPYLLGFQPSSGDIVAMGTVPPRNRIQLTLRWDLPEPDAPVLAAAHARRAVAALAANGCTQVAAVGFGLDQLVAPSITAVREAAKAAGLKVWDLLRAEDGRCWSYLCTDSACCPPDGTPCNTAGDLVAAAYEAAGERVLASGDVLAATVAPASEAEVASMQAAVLRAARRLARNTTHDAQRRAAGKESRPNATADHRAVKAAITTYRRGGTITSHDELAWLALTLSRIPVRDLACTLMDPGHRDAHVRLWTDLTRLAVPGLVAAPASLLALCAWQAGNGALAQIALDRALDDDPGYPMARLLRDAVTSAAPPSLADPAPALRHVQAALGGRPPTGSEHRAFRANP